MPVEQRRHAGEGAVDRLQPGVGAPLLLGAAAQHAADANRHLLDGALDPQGSRGTELPAQQHTDLI